MASTERRRRGGRPARAAWALGCMVGALVAAAGLSFALPRAGGGRPPAVRRRAAAAPATPAAAPRDMPRAAAEVAAAAGVAAARHEVRIELLAAAAATCRGQCGSEAERSDALRLVEALERLNPTEAPARETAMLEGEWQLVFASEDVTRSSPFFWAWRQLLRGVEDPLPLTRSAFGTESLSESIFTITDNIPVKKIGEAAQSISDGRLVNRVAVSVFGVGRTMMTTTSRILPPELDGPGDELSLRVETTQAADSSLPFADSYVFPSEELLGAAAEVSMRITYLDDGLRIVRVPADDQVFVYVRAQ